MTVTTASTATGGMRLALDGIGIAYGGTTVLAGVDLEIAPGEILVVVGKSGCGKSTPAPTSPTPSAATRSTPKATGSSTATTGRGR
ncbi:hypothetical protein IU433_00655 [Nocardia puris]|uniref:ABC transporter family protein n=1 Tax=Nocardia puris TaxID=208602 RepID=A0A366DUX0_9NOCA|nr:ATP-binding cassette domain-containing protein [Nocardia puris]MBF6210294.1 hypothetical protein [Nocardia puris]MBF6367369.1 hypothetical protein [Nocardia puris]MBF6457554.1 hypothetical protein [Nocardia puris]RBO93715.1 ABC transporter family protein [Nocardia puris]